jgi:hypothetical protein
VSFRLEILRLIGARERPVLHCGIPSRLQPLLQAIKGHFKQGEILGLQPFLMANGYFQLALGGRATKRVASATQGNRSNTSEPLYRPAHYRQPE